MSAAGRAPAPFALAAIAGYGMMRAKHYGVVMNNNRASHRDGLRVNEGMRTTDGFKHGFAQVNGARLHYAEAGHGPLVMLLHGFPEL